MGIGIEIYFVLVFIHNGAHINSIVHEREIDYMASHMHEVVKILAKRARTLIVHR